jgi:hypothetical protein
VLGHRIEFDAAPTQGLAWLFDPNRLRSGGIIANTSPEDAADLLFGHHSGIGGSGHLDEYLEQPARLALARPNSFPAQQK